MEKTQLTGNQVVAYNLFLARVVRGWTQEEAAEQLEPYLGELWTKATFSAAERSVAGRRIRHFDADEILAFAQAFDRPVSWFFTPPMPEDPLRRLPTIAPPKDAHEGQLVDASTLTRRSMGAGHLLEGRIEPALAALDPPDRDQRTHELEDEADAWRRWRQGYAITREKDRKARKESKR
jgi:hypothetical protein